MRDTKNNNTIIEGKLSKPEFAIIKEWHLFEKIHPKFDSLSDLLF